MTINPNKEISRFEVELSETKTIQMTQSEYQRYVEDNTPSNSNEENNDSGG